MKEQISILINEKRWGDCYNIIIDTKDKRELKLACLELILEPKILGLWDTFQAYIFRNKKTRLIRRGALLKLRNMGIINYNIICLNYRIGKREERADFWVLFYDIETLSNKEIEEVGYIFVRNCYNIKISKGNFERKEKKEIYIEIIGIDFRSKITKYLEFIFCNIKKEGVKERYIYSHNFTGFDSFYILNSVAELLNSNNISSQIIGTDNWLSGIIIKRGEEKLYILDRIKLLNNRLKNLGKSFERKSLLVKPEVNFDIYNIENLDYLKTEKRLSERGVSKKYLEKWGVKNRLELYLSYCKNDVYLLSEIWIKNYYSLYKAEWGFNNNNFRIKKILSTSSLSLNLIILNTKRVIDLTKLNDNTIKTIVRSSYYGGRTERFYLTTKNKEDKIYYFDFNRIYPNIVIKHAMPTGAPIIITRELLNSIMNNIIKIKQLRESWIVFLNITWEVGIIEYPILPVRGRVTKLRPEKLLFPVGKGRGRYYLEEIIFALETGYKLLKITKGVIFEKSIYLRSYIEKIIRLKDIYKKRGDKVKEYQVKILINRLTGRFGINDKYKIELLKTPGEDKLYRRVLWEYTRTSGNKIKLIKSEDITKFDRNVGISRVITSLGRIKLIKSVYKVIDANPERYLIYTDTDSIFFGSCTTIKSVEIGDGDVFNIQKVYREGYFAGAKLYCLRNIEGKYEVIGRGVNSKTKNNTYVVNQFKNILRTRTIIIPDNKKFLTKIIGDGGRGKKVVRIKIENNIVRRMKRVFIQKGLEEKRVNTLPFNTKDVYLTKIPCKVKLGWNFGVIKIGDRDIKDVESKFIKVSKREWVWKNIDERKYLELYILIKVLLNKEIRRCALKLGSKIDGESKYIRLGEHLNSHNFSCLSLEQFELDLRSIINKYMWQYQTDYPEFFIESNVKIILETFN